MDAGVVSGTLHAGHPSGYGGVGPSAASTLLADASASPSSRFLASDPTALVTPSHTIFQQPARAVPRDSSDNAPPWTGRPSSSATVSTRPPTPRPRTVWCAGPSATRSSRSIDAPSAGRDAGEVLDGRSRGIPVRASIADALRALPKTPDFCIVGVATSGGRVTPGLRALLAEAIEAGMSIVNGLHELAVGGPRARGGRARGGASRSTTSARRPPARSCTSGAARSDRFRAPRLAVLGTDCAVGKRTTARFLRDACRAAGLKTELIFTGQTGWMQGAPYGFIFDSIPNDFVSGELEHAIVSCWKTARPELILLEGQSSLRNPSGPCGSEFLLSGGARGVVLQHAPGTRLLRRRRGPGVEDPSRGRGDRPDPRTRRPRPRRDPQRRGSVGARALRDQQRRLSAELALPVVLPLEEGVDALVPVVREFVASEGKP